MGFRQSKGWAALASLALACWLGASCGGGGGSSSANGAPGNGSPGSDASGGGASSQDTGAGLVPGTLRGVAWLGGPVRGGEVRLLPLRDDLTIAPETEALAETTTNDRGEFELHMKTIPENGAYVVVVGGPHAVYASNITGHDEVLDFPKALRALYLVGLAPATVHDTLHLDLYRALVFELTRGLVWSGEVPDLQAAYQIAELRLRRHLFRNQDDSSQPPPDDVDGLYDARASMPGDDDFDPSTPPGELGLVRLGWAQLGARWQADADASPFDFRVTEADVLYALQLDAANGLFDGAGPYVLDPKVETLPVQYVSGHTLSVEETRRELAWSIWDATAAMSDVRSVISAPWGLLERIATDDGPLYPPAVPAQPFDPNGPKVQWVPPTPEEQAFVSGTFQGRARASDPSGIDRIEAVDPPGLLVGTLEPGPDGAAEATVTLPLDGFDDGPVTIVVRAVDGQEQATVLSRTVHIDSTPPEVDAHFADAVELPQLDAWGVAAATVTVEGSVHDPAPDQGVASGVANVHVQIGDGEPVEADVSPDGSWSVTLDLPQGTADVAVTAADSAGNESEAVVVGTIYRDETPPALEITAPKDGDWVGDLSAQVSGTAVDAGVGDVTVTVRNPDTDAEQADSVDATGSFSIQAPPFVAAGAGTLVVEARDALGNTASTTLNLHVDLDPPAISVDHDTWWAKPAESVELTGTASDDDSGLDSVEVCPAGSDAQCVPAQLDGTGAWSALVQAPPADGGVAALDAVATDAVGHAATASTSVRADGKAPVIEITSPMMGGVVWTKGSTLQLDGTADDGTGSGVASVTVDAGSLVAGSSVTLGQASPDGVRTWSAALTFTADGVVPASVEAADAVGNIGTLAPPVHVGRDTTPPLLTVETPADGGWIATTTPIVTGQATDSGVGGVTVTVTQAVTGNSATAPAASDGTFSVEAPPAPVDGVQMWSVSARDALGNQSAPTTLTLHVDTTPPVFAALPATVFWGKPAGPVTVEVSVSDAGIGVDSVQACRLPDSILCVDATPKPPTAWSLSLTAPGTDGASESWEITATDGLGNQASETVELRADGTPPALSVDGAANGNIMWFGTSTVELSGTVSDTSSGVQTVTAAVDGGLPQVADYDSAKGTWTIALPNIPEGPHTVSIKALDAVGNPTAKNQTVYVDMTKPGLTVQVDSGYYGWERYQYEMVSDADANKSTWTFSLDPAVEPVPLSQCTTGDNCKVVVPLNVAIVDAVNLTSEATVTSSGVPHLRTNAPDTAVQWALAHGYSASVDVTCTWVATFEDGSSTAANTVPAVPADGEWLCPLSHDSIEWDAPYDPPGGGRYKVTLTVSATDPAGNSATLDRSFDLTIATPPPTVSMWLLDPLVLEDANGNPAQMISFENGNWDAPFAPGAQRTRIFGVRIDNPYPFPLEDVTLAGIQSGNDNIGGFSVSGKRYKSPSPVCSSTIEATCSDDSLSSSDCCFPTAQGLSCAAACKASFAPIPGEDTDPEGNLWGLLGTQCEPEDQLPAVVFDYAGPGIPQHDLRLVLGPCDDAGGAPPTVSPPTAWSPATVSMLPAGSSTCGHVTVPLADTSECLVPPPSYAPPGYNSNVTVWHGEGVCQSSTAPDPQKDMLACRTGGGIVPLVIQKYSYLPIVDSVKALLLVPWKPVAHVGALQGNGELTFPAGPLTASYAVATTWLDPTPIPPGNP